MLPSSGTLKDDTEETSASNDKLGAMSLFRKKKRCISSTKGLSDIDGNKNFKRYKSVSSFNNGSSSCLINKPLIIPPSNMHEPSTSTPTSFSAFEASSLKKVGSGLRRMVGQTQLNANKVPIWKQKQFEDSPKVADPYDMPSSPVVRKCKPETFRMPVIERKPSSKEEFIISDSSSQEMETPVRSPMKKQSRMGSMFKNKTYANLSDVAECGDSMSTPTCSKKPLPLFSPHPAAARSSNVKKSFSRLALLSDDSCPSPLASTNKSLQPSLSVSSLSRSASRKNIFSDNSIRKLNGSMSSTNIRKNQPVVVSAVEEQKTPEAVSSIDKLPFKLRATPERKLRESRLSATELRKPRFRSSSPCERKHTMEEDANVIRRMSPRKRSISVGQLQSDTEDTPRQVPFIITTSPKKNILSPRLLKTKSEVRLSTPSIDRNSSIDDVFLTPCGSFSQDVFSSPLVARKQSSDSDYGSIEMPESVKGSPEKIDVVLDSQNSEEIPEEITMKEVTPTTRNGPTKRSVRFSHLDVFYFARQQGGDTVPHSGEVSLGMVRDHFSKANFPLHNGRRPIISFVEEEELSEGEEVPDRYDPHGYEHASTFNMARIEGKTRIKMLKKSGVAVVKCDNPMNSLDNIRLSRLECGCDCPNGVCVPDTCSCYLNGIHCQVDGPMDDGSNRTHPCQCSQPSCHNPNGRSEFKIDYVKSHFHATVRRLKDMGLTGIYASPQIIRFDDDGNTHSPSTAPYSSIVFKNPVETQPLSDLVLCDVQNNIVPEDNDPSSSDHVAWFPTTPSLI